MFVCGSVHTSAGASVEGVWSLDLRVAVSPMTWVLGPLQEQWVFLLTEPLLQPHNLHF